MDNLKDGSTRLWASAVFFAIFTLYGLYTLNGEWRAFVGLRWAFLVEGDPDAKGGRQLAYSVRLEEGLGLKLGRQLAYSVRLE